MKKIYLLMLTALILSSCEQEATDVHNIDSTLASVPIEPMTAGDGLYDALGYGYDITEEYLSFEATKRSVLDVSALVDASEKGTFDDPYIGETDERTFYGSTSIDFMNNIAKKSNFDGSIAAGVDKDGKPLKDSNSGFLFGAGVTRGSSSQYSYSSRYSFMRGDYFHKSKQKVLYVEPSDCYEYLAPLFKKALNEKSPDAVVAEFGTHVLLDFTLGGQLMFSFRGDVVGEASSTIKEKATSAGLNFIAGAFGLNFKGGASSSETNTLSKKNVDWSCFVKVIGGKGSGNSYKIDKDHNVEIGFDPTTWVNSITDNQARVVDINWNRTYPIYEFIKDPIKKAQIKAAVERYLKSRTITMMNLVLIHRYWNGTDHFFTTEMAPTVGGGGWKYEHPVFYVPKTGSIGSVPFHRYWNGKDHHYTTEKATWIGSWKYEEVAFDVYPGNIYVPSAVPLHRYWNGTDHFFTTEKAATVGGGSWKYEFAVAQVFPLE